MTVRTLLAAALFTACGSVALAQHDAQPTKPSKPMPAPAKAPERPAAAQPGSGGEDMQKMMEAMEAAGKPGPGQENVAQLAGEWDCLVKFQTVPGQPWMESHATASSKMIYDGRYLQEEVTGEFSGMPFHGMGILGFNNLSKQYQGTWIDNMSTQIETLVGTYDSSKKTFTMNADLDDPMTGKRTHNKQVTVINSADKHTSEFFEVSDDGKEKKVMEITYTRAPDRRPMMDQPAHAPAKPASPTR